MLRLSHINKSFNVGTVDEKQLLRTSASKYPGANLFL